METEYGAATQNYVAFGIKSQATFLGQNKHEIRGNIGEKRNLD